MEIAISYDGMAFKDAANGDKFFETGINSVRIPFRDNEIACKDAAEACKFLKTAFKNFGNDNTAKKEMPGKVAKFVNLFQVETGNSLLAGFVFGGLRN